MLYEVDFAIKVNDNFHIVHKEFVYANSVSECQGKAKEIRKELHQNNVHIFIEA